MIVLKFHWKAKISTCQIFNWYLIVEDQVINSSLVIVDFTIVWISMMKRWLADRGFQMKEELMLKFCTLSVPSGARVKSQMTTAECKTTKDVANLIIHVECAINRIKTFRILKSILPITMLHNIDNIDDICCTMQVTAFFI